MSGLLMLVNILIISVFCAVFMYSLLTLLLTPSEKVTVKKRLAQYLKSADIDEVQDQVIKEKRERIKKEKSKKYQLATREFTNYLLMSGVKLSAREYVILWFIASVGPSLLAFLLTQNPITAIALGVVGFAVPPVLVQRSRKKRQEEFNKQLGEALPIMGNCIKAGFTFQQAMESISAEMQPPITTEFSRALREVQYGVSLEEALNHMVERVKNKDLDLLVSAVLTSARVGGNLSEILEVISDTIRDRLRIKAEIKVMTASGRASGMIIGLLPIFIILFLMIINPDYFMSFVETNAGKAMMVLSVILEITGFAVINKIVNIKY